MREPNCQVWGRTLKIGAPRLYLFLRFEKTQRLPWSKIEKIREGWAKSCLNDFLCHTSTQPVAYIDRGCSAVLEITEVRSAGEKALQSAALYMYNFSTTLRGLKTVRNSRRVFRLVETVTLHYVKVI